MPAAELAFASDPRVAVLQDHYSVTMKFRIEHLDRAVFAALFGDPLTVMLWWDMATLYRPFWFLERTENA